MSAIKVRPFHETIIDALDNSYANGMGDLVELIKMTTIPNSHSEIIAAIDKKWGHVSPPHKWAGEIAKLKASVLIQEQRVKAETKAETETTDTTLDQLEVPDRFKSDNHEFMICWGCDELQNEKFILALSGGIEGTLYRRDSWNPKMSVQKIVRKG